MNQLLKGVTVIESTELNFVALPTTVAKNILDLIIEALYKGIAVSKRA